MIGTDAMAKTLLNRVDVADLGVTKALAGGLAEIERAQAEAVRELADAHGFDIDVQEPDPEERKRVLLEGAEAATEGRGVEWWIETRYGHRLDNAAEAAEFRDLEPDTWTEAEREQSAELIRERFGVELDWFVSEIVGLDRSEVVRELLAGNLESIELAIRDAAEQDPEPPDDG
ncbi:hypothetical protein EXE43_09545 [Halorubrum sp. SS5]|nr:hypothetical protein EXE43_09545 [Halorubrum sp. SS5]